MPTHHSQSETPKTAAPQQQLRVSNLEITPKDGVKVKASPTLAKVLLVVNTMMAVLDMSALECPPWDSSLGLFPSRLAMLKKEAMTLVKGL
jgi:hypothetical protein